MNVKYDYSAKEDVTPKVKSKKINRLNLNFNCADLFYSILNKI